MNIGVDFGGVLSVHDGGNTEHKNTLINMPFALETLQKLKDNGNKLYLVSFCGKTRAIETKKSIELSGATHLFENQFYVRNREYKADICEHIGCNFMIDDREEILDNVIANNKKITTILFGSDHANNKKHMCAKDWNDVFEIITRCGKLDKVDGNNSINIGPLIYRV